MRLSEAILLGIGGVKNNRIIYLVNSCGCAIGTALWAIGYKQTVRGVEDCHKEWPWTKQLMENGLSIAGTISARHYGGESRESLAAWVAEQEVRLGVVDTEIKEEVKEIENAPA